MLIPEFEAVCVKVPIQLDIPTTYSEWTWLVVDSFNVPVVVDRTLDSPWLYEFPDTVDNYLDVVDQTSRE